MSRFLEVLKVRTRDCPNKIGIVGKYAYIKSFPKMYFNLYIMKTQLTDGLSTTAGQNLETTTDLNTHAPTCTGSSSNYYKTFKWLDKTLDKMTDLDSTERH